uniref:Retinol binding protein 7b, cellular n=1 Tax=Oreochromis niloticus TaxID=8128 RepID=A0A669EK91_ORENI
MPANLSGTWDMVSNVNFEGYMVALGVDFPTRKIASMLKPQKVIKQDGDCFTIQTLSTLKNYECSFKTGEEFEEVTKGMDNRTFYHDLFFFISFYLLFFFLINRGWTHWLEGDELHLELTCGDQVCKQIYKRTL